MRVLVALLVYNGRTFVPRAIESLARMAAASQHDVEVVVFDDASPEPGFSEAVSAQCTRLGVGYYCTPRNLGIPRNMNLGLLLGEECGHDLVVLCNSDVVVPANLADALADVAATDPRIGTVTAWSNNASIFSVPNSDGEEWLSDPVALDAVSATLTSEFGTEPLDLPVGMGFCLALSTAAIRDVGLMDPVFGRGYCEEVDWCRRAAARGWRNVLARNTYVFHMGSASSRLAGLLAPGEQTVQVNESIIDQRHPTYRDETERWVASGVMEESVQRSLRRLVHDAGRAHGYVVEATWLRRRPSPFVLDPRIVRVTVNPDGPHALVEAAVQGWRFEVPVTDDGIVAALMRTFDAAPTELRILDHGSVASSLEEAAGRIGVPVVASGVRYPSRV